MKQKITILFILIMLVSFAMAQDPPKPPKQVLKAGDVERFITTFPQLEKDMKAFNMKYEAKSGDVTIPEALRVSSEFMAVLKKHGWDEGFWEKWPVILLGYSSIVYGKEMKKANVEMEKSLKEIDSNPNIPASMKQQLKDQLKDAQGIMATQGDAFLKNVHPKDLELVKPHIEAIKKIIDKDTK